MQRSVKIIVLVIVAVLLVATVSAVLILQMPQGTTVLKVFTAGSLSEPFDNMENNEDLETIFETEHPNVDVQISSGGSATMIRRITDLNQTCDVLAVADYSLIPLMMINSTHKTADFALQFAKNSIILAYTDMSRYADEINSSNWMDILRKPDVKFGFSSPNDDPCGYRSQMVMILAEQYYGDPTIYEDLVMNNTNIDNVTVENGITAISIPSSLTVINSDKVMIRSAEVDLTNALETGSIDYLFIYKSVAYRHADSGEKYIELPSQINLNDTAHTSLYEKVKVIQFADNSNASKIKTVVGSPIVYGLTIPKNSENPTLAMEFIKLVIGEEGQQVMQNAGQEPIDPAIAGYWNEEVPEGIRDMVV
ncbi:MAG: tungstate ABC transporter substrate-binding protein WtpA [Thermoplasmata archaeon]|nr:tungstate ABC transporter substrate-binding protein WtpA [Thermoplasmata archaeon]